MMPGLLLDGGGGYRAQSSSAMTATSGYASMSGYSSQASGSGGSAGLVGPGGPPPPAPTPLHQQQPMSLPPYQPPPLPLSHRAAPGGGGGGGSPFGVPSPPSSRLAGVPPPPPPPTSAGPESVPYQSTPLAHNQTPSPPVRQMSPLSTGSGGHQYQQQPPPPPPQQDQHGPPHLHQQQMPAGSGGVLGACGGTLMLQQSSTGQQQNCGERVVWEFHNVSLTRVPGYGFGIAVSGGRDNPHFTNGDPAIAISDVLRAGPAEGKLQINDRVLSANGVSLENVTYETAVGVLRDSGPTLHLVVKRRIVLPSTPSADQQAQNQTFKLTLTRPRKKDDFGVVLGCRIYVKEVLTRSIADRDGCLREGDVVTNINSHSTENMSLKEARKLVDGSKDRVHLVVRRERPLPSSAPNAAPGGGHALVHGAGQYENEKDCGAYQVQGAQGSPSPFIDISDARPNYSNQNLYVQPPTRGQHGHSSSLLSTTGLPGMASDGDQPGKGGSPDSRAQGVGGRHLAAAGYDGAAGAVGGGGNLGPGSGLPQDSDVPPLRPPLPREPGLGPGNQVPGSMSTDYYSTRKDLFPQDSSLSRRIKPSQTSPDPRFISFRKEGSVGIRLTGGNQVGIFVTAVQPGSPAFVQGLQPGDKLLKVNDVDMKGVTREEAVLFLLSLQDQVDLIVQYRAEEYDDILAHQKGDSFYIKTHFNYETPQKGEMSFRKGDVFHVVDTLHNGVVGSWQVYRIGRHNEETQKGTIPNKSRAEELATAQFNASKKDVSAESVGPTKGSFFRRKRAARRSKSLCKDPFDDMLFNDSSSSKFPAYERVSLCHPGFTRPIVLFGPLADVARDRLLKDSPDRFCSPQMENRLAEGTKKQGSGIIRLSAIREIIDRGKHAVLDVTPNAVDKLNYAQFYPITIFIKAESKAQIKELRSRNNPQHKSSRKLFDQCLKLEKHWSQIFTSTLTLTGSSDNSWYGKTRDIIDRQQSQPIWMSETKPEESLADDFLFPMASRLSYASSPAESDVENGAHSRSRSVDHHRNNRRAGSGGSSSPGGCRLERSSSDPNLAPGPPQLLGPSGSGVPTSTTAVTGGGGGGGQSMSGMPPSTSTLASGHGVDDGPPTYSGPPPYSAGPYQPDYETQAEMRRRSQEREGKHGYGTSGSPTRQSRGFPSAGLANGNPSSVGLPLGVAAHHGRSGSGSGSGSAGSGPNSLPLVPMMNGVSAAAAAGSSSAYDPYSLLPPNKPPAPKMGVLSSDLAAGRALPGSYPLPHHMGSSGSAAAGAPELPPKIDRSKKPGKKSAQERLFGTSSAASSRGDENSGWTVGGPSPLMAHSPVLPRNPPSTSSKSNYDTYDPYRLEQPGMDKNGQDSAKSTTPPGSNSSIPSHDPYKFTRSSAQPIKTSTLERHRSDDGQPKFASTDIKPVPPPKNAVYKPVPPPKPKSFRTPGSYPGHMQPQPGSNYSDNYSSMNYVASSSAGGSPDDGGPGASSYANVEGGGVVGGGGYYSTAGSNGTLRSGQQYSSRNADDYASDTYVYGTKYSNPLLRNGTGNGGLIPAYNDDDASNGFDSGHGSSLDRNYESFGRNYGKGGSRNGGGQYYLNVPPPKDAAGMAADHSKKNATLDHREHRGSAFELYKKPHDPRTPFEYSVR